MTFEREMNPTPVLPYDKTTKNVLDYIPATYYINSILGFKQRNAGEYFYTPERKHMIPEDQRERLTSYSGVPYLDYWHYVLDLIGVDGNDSFAKGMGSFVEIHEYTKQQFGENDWRTYISKVWADTYPEEYTLWLSW